MDTAVSLLQEVKDNEPEYDYWWCLWCNEQRPEEDKPIPHEKDCLYRRIIEFLAKGKVDAV